jgi:hypothetical protein
MQLALHAIIYNNTQPKLSEAEQRTAEGLKDEHQRASSPLPFSTLLSPSARCSPTFLWRHTQESSIQSSKLTAGLMYD